MLNRSASFVVAGLAGAVALTAASAPSPLYPVYQQLWHFSAFTLTVVFAVYVFALLAALLTVGSLSDHVGRRPVASVALLVLALGMVLFATAGSAADLVVARVVQGLAIGAATGTTTAMVMDHAPTARRGSSVSSVVPTLGLAIGMVVAGALVQFAPHPRQLVFWLLAAVYVVAAALVWLTPERRPQAARAGSSVWATLRPSAALPREVRPVFAAAVPAIVATWALAGLYLSLGSSVIGTVLQVHSHFLVGIILGTFFLAGVVGTLVRPLLPERSRDAVGYATLALGVATTVVATLTATATPYVLGSALAGVGFGATFSAVVAVLAGAAPADRRGEVFATMYVVSYLAFSLPALVAGLADQAFGLAPTVATYGVVVIVLTALAPASRVVRDRRRRSRTACAGSVPGHDDGTVPAARSRCST